MYFTVGVLPLPIPPFSSESLAAAGYIEGLLPVHQGKR